MEGANIMNTSKRRHSLRSTIAFSALILSCAAAEASAQSPAGTSAAQAPESDGDVGEIVVTAEKRASSIQRVPIAMTAITGGSLAASGVTDVNSLATQIPSFDFGESFGAVKLAIRGIGFSNQSTGAEGSVAYNLNDVYVSRPVAQLGQFYDIDRVEVLRGPQGTLYGRNASAGAVNVYTNRPTDTWGGFGQLTIGNYSNLVAEGGIGGPISDTIGVRLAFYGENRDGYGKNVFTGRDIEDANLRAGRLTVRLKPASNFTIDVIGDIQRERSSAHGNHLIAQRGLTGELGVSGQPITSVQLGGTPITTGWNISSDIDPRYRRHGGGIVVDARLELGDVTLRSVSGWRHSYYTINSDADGGTEATAAQIRYREVSDTYSQEFNVNATIGRLDVTGGVYGFAENLDGLFWIPASPAIYGAPYVPGVFIANFAQGGHLKSRALAAFGQFSYHATDQLTLTLGARYSSEKKTDDDLYTDFITSTLYLQPADFQNPNPPLSGPFTNSKRWDSFTPKFGVNYQATPSTLLYASISKGFKAGLFNIGGTQVIPTASGIVLSNPPINPEKVWAYEGGLKTRLLDRRLRLNLAAFYYDYSDLQLSKVDGQTVALTNAASAEIYGIEGEVDFTPVDRLKLNASASWLHARFTDFVNTDQGRPALGPIDLEGNKLPQAPTFTISGGIEYRIPWGSGEFIPRVQANYSTRVYFDEFNVDAISQPAFAKLDLSLTYQSNAGFLLTAFVNNVTDRRTIETAYQSSALVGSPVSGYLAAPRTYGIRGRYSF